jgi:hypothetical protein
VQRSRYHLGALAPVLAVLVLGLVMAFPPHEVRGADYDVEVDACALIGEADIQALTAWTDYATDSLGSSASESTCFWGSVRAGESGYVELIVSRRSSFEPRPGSDCDVTPVTGVGEDAAFAACPTDVFLHAYERGAMVSLQVDQPAEPLTADDLAPIVRAIFGQLGTLPESSAPVPSAAPSTDGGIDGAPAAPADPAGGQPFADAVPAPGEISTDPIVLLQSALLAALLVFLMPFPSQLFNSTLEAHEDEVRRWFRLDRVGAIGAGLGAFWGSWPGVAIFTVLATVLYGFLDPGFGLDLGSLATFAGMLVGIVLVTTAFAVPAVLAHRRIGSGWTPKVVPLSLLIGVGCVLVSRLTGFQPGYLYGLLIGLAFARELSAAEEGRATALGAVAMVGVALLSWLTLGALPDGDAFGLVVARTTLAALMVAGLEGVVFGLLPMRFLPGETLYAWNRVAWAALLAIGAFAFFHILINPASGYLSDTSRTPLLTVLGLLIGFSLVSVAFWAWFRYRDRPAGPMAPASTD